VALLPLLLLVLPGRAHVVLDPPTGSGDAVIVVRVSSGTGTAESVFSDHPDLVVAGDGTVYRQDQDGLATFRVDHDTVLRWLRAADDHGLLDHTIESPMADGLMDAGGTTVVLDAGRVQRRHYVYGLGERFGFSGMARYVDDILDWAGDQPTTSFRPTVFRVLTHDDAGYHCTVSPTVVPSGGDVLAVAALLPGERCTDDW
jgi:hypothetical protein